MKQRIDIWTAEQDVLLAETVLQYIREGGTQLQAFDEVGEKLTRTSGGCAFRWNGVVRHQYTQAIEQAKKDRLKLKHTKITRPAVAKQVELVLVAVENKTVSVDDLEVKEFKGQRVVTFKDIDEVHGRPEGTASRNFLNNKERLIEGEDYFIIKSQNNEIRGFENIPNRGVTVLTESGYLMLVKSFTDDLAWEVQRKLVKTYFKVKEAVQNPIHSYMIMDPIERAKVWIREHEEKKQIETEKLLLEQQFADLAPKMTYLDTILESKDSIIVSQISADYGLSAQALNKILHEEGVQYKRNDQWLLYSEHTGQGYTESRTIPFVKPNGDTGSSIQTRWTQKGRLFIHNILSKRGIKPLMDR